MKKILTGIVFAAVMVLAACSGGDTQMSEEDAALRQELTGVWFYPDSAEYDEDGDLTSFSAYQFTDDEVVKCHNVESERTVSYLMGKYTIKDGKFVIDSNGRKQYAVIEIRETDGKDHLFWEIDTGTLEFIRMTDEEIEEYGVPVDKMLTGEAELLGLKTTAEEDPAIADESETEAVSEE